MCAATDLRQNVLRRVFDASRLNELANHPLIRPTCGGDGESFLDFTPFVENLNNHAVVWDYGAFLFFWSAPHTYEVHIMVEPEGRGLAAYRMAARGISYMVAHGADRLWARVAEDAPSVRHYIAQAGFRRCGIDALDIGFGPVTYDLYQWKKPCHQQL